jgi:inhibitor of KinA
VTGAASLTDDGAARFLDAGEAALVVEFGRTIEPAVHQRVLALDAALTKRALPGVTELVPTIRSLMIHYDPLTIDRATLIAAVRGIETGAVDTKPKRRWRIPCCYDLQFGEDIAQIGEMLSLTPERVVALHSGAIFQAYMYGFLPGFCYLGGLPQELTVPRRATIRTPHPPGTIMIGAGMGLITTFSMPTGWWLVGRTPERMFSLKRERTFLAAVGDEISFAPIDIDTFHALDRRAEAGEIVATVTELS